MPEFPLIELLQFHSSIRTDPWFMTWLLFISLLLSPIDPTTSVGFTICIASVLVALYNRELSILLFISHTSSDVNEGLVFEISEGNAQIVPNFRPGLRDLSATAPGVPVPHNLLLHYVNIQSLQLFE